MKNVLAPIEEIDYFTFSNNSDVVSLNETLPFLFLIYDDVYDKQDATREYFAMSRHADVDCFYLCHVCKDTEASYM